MENYGTWHFDATEYMMNMNSREFILKNCQSQSATVWIYIGALRMTLKDIIWLATQLRWRNWNIVRAAPMHPVTRTWQITDIGTLGSESATLTILIQSFRCRLNRLARTSHLLNLLRQCWYDTRSCSTLCKRFHIHCQRRQSTMCHFSVSAWQTTIPLCNARTFRINSTRCLSIRTKPTFLLLQDSCDGTHRNHSAHVRGRSIDQHQRYNDRWMPQTWTPYSTAKSNVEHVCSRSVSDTVTREKLKAKVQRTVAFTPYDRPPHNIVSYLTQSDSSSTSRTQRGSSTFIQTKYEL